MKNIKAKYFNGRDGKKSSRVVGFDPALRSKLSKKRARCDYCDLPHQADKLQN